MINEKTLKTLEFDVILKILSSFAVSEISKELVLASKTNMNFDAIERLQSLTEEAYFVKEKYLLNPVVRFDDISLIINKTKIGAILSMGELLKIVNLLRSARIAKSNIDSTGSDIILLKKIAECIVLPKSLEKEITAKILSDTEISDDASEKLKAVRRKILSTNIRLKDKLGSYTKNSGISKYLQDNIVTVRSGRYVIPVRAEFKGEIQGLIHDQSASGSTVYVEPFPVVELNNELRTLQLEEAAEVERILWELTGKVGEIADNLLVCQNIVADIDVIFAKCTYSQSLNGTRPRLDRHGSINLINSRHPLIAKDKVVPVSVKVGSEYRILLISGPNTGGKTVCLKTVGLFCLMAYIGLRIPCDDGSEVSMFDDIYCDIGDEQSIINSLSTFSSHMNNIVFITNKLGKNSLVLLDELGGGTDPLEGAALAVGILKHIEKNGAVAVVTTHYTELKEYAFESRVVENACMLFDEKTMRPSYKLVIGMPGTSNALRIATNLGLRKDIIDEAYKNIDSEKLRFENILKNAEDIKNKSMEEYQKYIELRLSTEREKELAQADRTRLAEKLEKLEFNSKLEIKKRVSKSLEEADTIIDEIKRKIDEGSESALLEAKRLRKELENIKYKNDEAFDNDSFEYTELEGAVEIGQKVAIKSLKMIGEVKALPNKNGEIIVGVGSAKINVKMADLASPVVRKVKKEKTSGASACIASNNGIPKEIKVLGMTVAEAIEELLPLITAMSSDNGPKVLKIVHGKGSGALGRGIHMHLRSLKCVNSFRYGRYGEGETGVTFVEIK